MTTFRFRLALCAALVCLLAAAPKAKSANDATAASAADAMAMREMLEGKDGRRQQWASAPSLIVISSVLDYTQGDLSSGFTAIDQTMTEKELAQLKADLTAALYELTDGTFESFKSISVEAAQPGDDVKVMRPGQVVVARYRGVQKKTGNIGYGGRMTHGESIVGAAVMLDAAYDAKSKLRQLLRTHELGHALGYHHVESMTSVMNARIGSAVTDFDRMAFRAAFDAPPAPPAPPAPAAPPATPPTPDGQPSAAVSNIREFQAIPLGDNLPQDGPDPFFGQFRLLRSTVHLVPYLQ